MTSSIHPVEQSRQIKRPRIEQNEEALNDNNRDEVDKELLDSFVNVVMTTQDVSAMLYSIQCQIGIEHFHVIMTHLIYHIRSIIVTKTNLDDPLTNKELRYLHIIIQFFISQSCMQIIESNGNANDEHKMSIPVDIICLMSQPLVLRHIRTSSSKEVLEKLYTRLVKFLTMVRFDWETALHELKRKPQFHIRSAIRVLQSIVKNDLVSRSSILGHVSTWYQSDVRPYLQHCQDNQIHSSKMYNKFTIVNHSKMLDFRSKLNVIELYGIDYQMRYRHIVHSNLYSTNEANKVVPCCKLHVVRDDIVQSILDSLDKAEYPLMPLRIFLNNEEDVAIDAGGVKVEIFTLLFSTLMDPKQGFFTIDDTDYSIIKPVALDPTIDFDTDTNTDTDHGGKGDNVHTNSKTKAILTKFFNIGRLMALALFNRVRITLPLGLTFFKQLVGQDITESDFQHDYPSVHKGLSQLRSFQGTNEQFQDTFCLDYQKEQIVYNQEVGSNGVVIKKAFIPLSQHIDPNQNVGLTDREMYINLYWQTECHAQSNPIVAAMICGFHNVLPLSLIQIFEPQELTNFASVNTKRTSFETIVSHFKFIDFDESEEDQMYKTMFVEILKDKLDSKSQQLFFQYVTAYSNLPPVCLSVPIIRIRNYKTCDPSHIPTASTCTLSLLLPRYANSQIMEDKIKKCIEHATSFGLS